MARKYARAQISFAAIGQDHDDGAATSQSPRDLYGRTDVGARRDADRQPLLAGLLACGLVTFVRDGQQRVPSLRTDLDWKEQSRCIGRTHPCNIPISPDWTLSIP